MRISVVLPVYNEAASVADAVAAILSAPLLPEDDLEIVAVDDGSSDESADILEALAGNEPRLRLVRHEKNQGKGAALRTAFAAAEGEVVIIQDADLEYDPTDYDSLLEPIRSGRADVVFGNRFGSRSHRVLYFWHYVGNKWLTTMSNIMTGLNLSDMEVGYKVFRREVLAGMTLRSKRFGIEPELVQKVARGNWRVYEVPVGYYGRTYSEGKKITWKDGLAAIWHIIRFRFSR